MKKSSAAGGNTVYIGGIYEKDLTSGRVPVSGRRYLPDSESGGAS